MNLTMNEHLNVKEAEEQARKKYPDFEPLVWHIPITQKVMVY
jgi:hypothetical protein